MSTAEIGLKKVYKKIEGLGASNLSIRKEGNKQFITFEAPTGKQYRVTTRARKSGTWQTSINYGEPCSEKLNETCFWIFVDLSSEQEIFYVIPLWWMKNDIHNAHLAYLKKHGGQRAMNNNSVHHSISRKRIGNWENAWEIIGL